jgi:Uma2 family endonuclease
MNVPRSLKRSYGRGYIHGKNQEGAVARIPEPKSLTADELFNLPVPPHLRGYELVAGKLVPVMPASPIHGRLMLKMGRLLMNYVAKNAIAGGVYGDVGCILGLSRDPERMRAPDVAFVSETRLRARRRAGARLVSARSGPGD